jgi:hypothetical protein
MSSKRTDLTAEAMEGFVAEPNAKCPYLSSSPAWGAWLIGRWLRTNRGAFCHPSNVRPSRGYTYHANGSMFRVDTATDQVKVLS